MEYGTKLREDLVPPQIAHLENQIKSEVVGQDHAVETLVRLHSRVLAGIVPLKRTLFNVLLLGPTGTGKTYLVEKFCEHIHPSSPKVIRPLKIDCGEFQHSHEVAKLIGAPPGYLGHKETKAALSQEEIISRQTINEPYTVVLFDEIEKASDAMYKILLGVLDKGELRLGDNSIVDFSSCIICMTSNLGAKEMDALLQNRALGFPSPAQSRSKDLSQAGQKAARRHFYPEFWNRIDEIIVFNPLSREDALKIVRLEIKKVQDLLIRKPASRILILPTGNALDHIRNSSFSKQYGARALKRTVDAVVNTPLAKFLLTGQIATGDVLVIDHDGSSWQYWKANKDPVSMDGIMEGYTAFYTEGASVEDAFRICENRQAKQATLVKPKKPQKEKKPA